MVQCEAMLAEGTGRTLAEEGVGLPGTSMLSSAGFCNTWLLGCPVPAVHGGQWRMAPPQGQDPLEQPRNSAVDATLPNKWLPWNLSRQLLQYWRGQFPREYFSHSTPSQQLCCPVHPTAPLPTGPESQLCWGSLSRGGGCS